MAHVINIIPCILDEKLVINPVDFITRAGMEFETFGTWDPVQHISTDPNDLHNKETITEIIQGTGITSEDFTNDS